MNEKLNLRTPYEELHRSFVLRLLEDKDRKGYRRNLTEFLRCFAGIHASVADVIPDECDAPWCIRARIKFNPVTVISDEGEKTVPQPDYVVDFLFVDSYRRVSFHAHLLADATDGTDGAKRALIHFGCSPESYAWGFIHNAPLESFANYDSFHSISGYEMSRFLGDGEHLLSDPFDRFGELYAGIIANHAKMKAAAEWKFSSQAFAFFCEKTLAQRISEALGKDVLVTSKGVAQSGADVCFSLVNDEWPVWEGEECIDIVYGTTLHVHYVTADPIAYVGLSHLGTFGSSKLGEEPISKEKYEKLFLGKAEIKDFEWVKSIDDPLRDEFAFGHRPIWIHCQDDNPLKPDDDDTGDWLAKEIVELIRNIVK